ncbi:TM0106 family RecB-like putative nuclease [Blastococcus atacamensis]|uniref:TM0106 family RecB-like putative nuclease n=1 Tax=Blastococcus atacamensis TaxID=2070508 RepID=UPI000CEC2BF7|nr:TM0106 family RecB-like putative nuclease [Blastococcus atacamensis]
MNQADGGMRYSATDLLTWHGCAHASRLDALALSDASLAEWLAARKRARDEAIASGADFPEPANDRGDEHERAMRDKLVAEGLDVVEIPRPSGPNGLVEAARATEQALHDGADVVYQAALFDEPWFGYADFLVRVDGVPSRFGDWAYEVRDTKLARKPSANALVQMAHYGSMLEQLQGCPPPRLVVWLGTGEEFTWAYEDAVPYLAELRERFLAFHRNPVETVAGPVDACGLCRWAERCEEEWGPDDLRHVHRLSRWQRTLLMEQGIATVQALASASDDDRPADIGPVTFERLRAQAAAQAGWEAFALVRPQPRRTGIAGTPAPDPLDIYFDLEGDPYAAIPTLDYLWAYCDVDGAYFSQWAHDAEGERAAFLWFLSELRRREELGGNWRVYHYNSYEVTSMERIAAAWPFPDERDRLVAEVEHFVTTRFDDLYRRVEAGLRTQDGSTSLKIVEKLAGYDRTAEAAAVGKADDSIKAYEAYLTSSDDDARAALLEGIRAYNQHDVKATRAVHLWLRSLTDELDDADLLDEPGDDYTPPDAVLLRAARTEELQSRLLVAAGAGPLASGLSAPGAEMLSEMLEWHRREFVVAYQDHLRLQAWAAEHDGAAGEPEIAREWVELNGAPVEETRIRRGTEHESCLLDVALELVHPPKTQRKNEALVREYRAAPGAWKLRAGADVVEVVPAGQDRPPLKATLIDHDPTTGWFSFKKQQVPAELGPLVATPFNGPETVWESLMRLGEAALVAEPPLPASTGLRLLDRAAPLPAPAMAVRAGEEAADRARRLLEDLTAGVLPVQGPPGTGKTWLAARLVLDEVARVGADGSSASIGVVANSHKVIDHLLEGVASLAASQGLDVAVGHVGKPDEVTGAGVAVVSGGGGKLRPWLDDHRAAGRPAVVGATKFGWARPDTAGALHLLVVDEAGQLSLADAVAVAQASQRVVALGDPQQLASPIQASHSEAVRVSLLEHLARGSAVLPAEAGVFLDVSRRMHPAVCEVVGALAYDGALQAHETASARSISGPDVVVGGHRIPLTPGVVWLPTQATEEQQAALVTELVGELVRRASVTVDGLAERLKADDVLVVAPHNAHVNRIRAALGGSDRVGTVDKFQGREGHVVVFAQGRPAEKPGDVPFLYEINRINVALSRARLMAIVVAHPDAVFPPVSQPEHLKLASRFARAVRERRAATLQEEN